jgi:hypothetical protein
MSDEIKAWEDRRDAYFKKMGEELGVLYAYMDKAGPRAINGYPMFFEFAMLHKSDWDIVRESITREQQRDIEL